MAKKYIADSVEATSITGSLFGTSSWATTSSYALNGGVTQIIAGNNTTITNGGSGSVTIGTTGGAFPFTGSAGILGSLNVDGSITASFFKGDGSALTNITGSSIAHLEFSNTEKTVWNNGPLGYSSNTSFGEAAFKSNIGGGYDTAYGNAALTSNTTGECNTGVGVAALSATTTGNSNVGLGFYAFNSSTTGNNNIGIGHNAGSNFNGDSSYNICIGRDAGPTVYAPGNKKLYIASGSGTPLIGGDFGAKTVTISGSLQVLGPITGSVQSSSYALSSSHASNGGVTSISNSTGITISSTTGAVTITNSAPDRTVTIVGSGATVVTGTYPNFTVTSTDTNTWNANTVSVAGYVSAPTSANLNKVWKTDGSGNPGWRDDVGTTITNNVDNRILTATGGTTSINGEANLTFNGTTLTVTGSAIVTGTVTAAGGFFNSDIRLKDITKQDGDVAYFTWKDGRDDKEHIGYIAQEIQTTHPDQILVGEDGYLSINYIEILVEKIRSMEKEIELLKSKL